MVRILAVTMALLASTATGEELRKFDFPVPNARNSLPPPTCGFPGLRLPANLRVFVASGYGGRQSGYQIDDSGNEATRFDIAVNSPNEPVAIMLGAYEPTVWNIGWTRGTRIVAGNVWGDYRPRGGGDGGKNVGI